MLKRFFISLLGTVAGIWISIVLAIFGGALLLGVALGSTSTDNAVKVEKKSILYFDLSGNIDERYQKMEFFRMIQNIDNKSLTLDEMLRSLEAAADDDRIEGLYINCNGAAMGTASREELIEAIALFKESGKWVTAYSDTYSQSDYLVASTADSIFLNPVGAVDIHGVGGSTPFFKGLLDKLGIKMQIVKVGTFKSAVEPYILTSMSEPARLQMQQYCDSIWSYVAGTIADNRGIAEADIRTLAPQMISTRQAETFISDDLVDGLKYRRQVTDYLRELTDIDADKAPRFVTPGDYLSSNGGNFSMSKDHIAVYYAVGEIV
ncbi:MAG: S49 family peptidase, partial [Muribaculaceae bacterium]|nr:S49 family peptidase [Muribaculaceae bacterium]